MSIIITKVCTKCGAEKMATEFGPDKRRKDGMRSWCRACDREYDKAGRDKIKRAERRENDSDYAKGYRESHRDGRKQYDERYWEKYPERRAAKQAVQNALRAGTLTSEPCEADGVHEGRVEAHHDDYGRPLEVRWLCVKHHKEWHHGLWAKYQMEKARADEAEGMLRDIFENGMLCGYELSTFELWVAEMKADLARRTGGETT